MKNSSLVGALFFAQACVGPMGPPGPAGMDGSVTSIQEYESFVTKLSVYEASVLNVECISKPNQAGEITTYRGSGSKIGLTTVLTALHVAEPAKSCSFWSNGLFVGSSGEIGDYQFAPYEYANNTPQDIATITNIYWTIPGTRLPIIPVIRDYHVKTGELVALLSYPYNITNNVQYAFGHVLDSQFRTDDIDVEAFTADYVAAHGSSGGPVFNRDAKVIGVHVAGYDLGVLDTHYAIPTNGEIRR